MSDIHVLTGDGLGSWTIVFHFPVPDQDNNVSVGYRVALVNSGLGGISVMTEGDGAGQVASAELAQIAAGEVYECSQPFLAESGATDNAEMLVSARAMYEAREPVVLARLRKQLRYFGYTGSVTVEVYVDSEPSLLERFKAWLRRVGVYRE